MTGVTMLAFELVGKRLEFLKEAVPKGSRVSVLSSPAHPGEQRELSETQKTAQSIGIVFQYHQVTTTADVNTASKRPSKITQTRFSLFPIRSRPRTAFRLRNLPSSTIFQVFSGGATISTLVA